MVSAAFQILSQSSMLAPEHLLAFTSPLQFEYLSLSQGLGDFSR